MRHSRYIAKFEFFSVFYKSNCSKILSYPINTTTTKKFLIWHNKNTHHVSWAFRSWGARGAEGLPTLSVSGPREKWEYFFPYFSYFFHFPQFFPIFSNFSLVLPNSLDFLSLFCFPDEWKRRKKIDNHLTIILVPKSPTKYNKGVLQITNQAQYTAQKLRQRFFCPKPTSGWSKKLVENAHQNHHFHTAHGCIQPKKHTHTFWYRSITVLSRHKSSVFENGFL